MSKKQIFVTPEEDLVAIVADAPKNSELILAPGKYVLNRPLVVDKTIRMRSRTGEANDVVIERNNETVLLVTDGKPTFQGIEFLAPAASYDAPVNSTEYDFVEYKSAVAVRQKGRATFIGCKASSRQKSGFSARGKRARITLEKCWVQKTGEGGIFVDEQACGLVKDSLIQDAGLGCVDAESKGSVLTVKNSTLARSGSASISSHDEGLIVVRNCKIDVGETDGACLINNGRLDVKNSQFFSELDDDTIVTTDSRYGVVVQSGLAKLTDCVMSKLIVGVFMESGDAKIKLKRVEIGDGTLASLVYCESSPMVKISNCKFADSSVEIKDFLKLLQRISQKASIAAWGTDDFSEEQKKRAYDVKTRYFEKILGKEYPRVGHSKIPFHEGGALDLYFYVNARYGGSYFLTKNLVSPEFSQPSIGDVDAFELAIGTRTPFYIDENGNTIPEYEPKYNYLFGKLGMAARQIWDDSSVARYETVEITDDDGKHYFIFDLLDEPEIVEIGDESQSALSAYASQPESRSQSQRSLSLDDALLLYSNSASDSNEASKEGKSAVVRRSFGVVVMIEIHKSEADYVDEHEGAAEILMAKLKEQNRWPLSDLDRPPIF